ncbi:MAG: hypothetical protein CMH78_04900 [Nitrospinae bacterium]|jgi:hypothetical protein|nr:hypothetical protein [Nitrospinota bacterium]
MRSKGNPPAGLRLGLTEIKWASAQFANENCTKITQCYKFVVQSGRDTPKKLQPPVSSLLRWNFLALISPKKGWLRWGTRKLR